MKYRIRKEINWSDLKCGYLNCSYYPQYLWAWIIWRHFTFIDDKTSIYKRFKSEEKARWFIKGHIDEELTSSSYIKY